MVVEKIKGAAKQFGAVLKGRAGILNTLTKEHGEVTSLMNKVASSSSFAEQAREQYPKIRRMLLLHSRAEQDTLYRACEKRPETIAALSDSFREHQRIEHLVGELDTGTMGSSQWEARFRELHRLVEHHMQEEEDRLFEACEKAFENEELRRLDDDFDRAKAMHEQQLGVPTNVQARATSAPHAAK